ncbi:hypothetical protein [Salimicrobium halophilum]|uniref:hypothetical protein n=1 Tax=Salimicrobium halophilum TaxID=86666 RepID=UPI001FE1EA77|nr:hypothetical protein [Salimicrobium halophilum]
METKTLKGFYDGNLDEVSKVAITDGNTGKRKMIEDKNTVEAFLNEMKDIEFIPEDNQEPRDGFNYAVTFYENEKETFQFGMTQVNDHYYHTEPDIFPIVDDFYETID